MAQDGIVSRRTVNNQECDILGNLLRVITDCYGQSDYTEGVYPCSFESNKWRVSWN